MDRKKIGEIIYTIGSLIMILGVIAMVAFHLIKPLESLFSAFRLFPIGVFFIIVGAILKASSLKEKIRFSNYRLVFIGVLIGGLIIALYLLGFIYWAGFE
ncbi:MAG: hypothetical protein ACTSYM_09590 [Candidatus Baldrarchaeia archaeon]